jgi:HSP20 family protein
MDVDVIETDNDFKIKANLPGVKKEDIKVFTKENTLIIEASHDEKICQNVTGIIRTERYAGKYQRLFTLPDNCDKENIKAKTNQGVLELTINKKEPAPQREIAIE